MEGQKNIVDYYSLGLSLFILDMFSCVSNVIASIASAFTTLVSTLVDTVIKFCKDMIVNAICSVLPAGLEWVKKIVDVALKGEYAEIPNLIMAQLKAEIKKMLGIVKEYVRDAMEKAKSAIANIEAYVNAIIELITEFLADPKGSLYALLCGEKGLGGELEKNPFIAQGKAFATSVGGIVNAVYGMKRDWKALLMNYSGIIMSIVLDFVKKYLPLQLPPNPTEKDIKDAIFYKMTEIVGEISQTISVELIKMLDSGITTIYESVEKALKDIDFYKKDVVMGKVREFLKEKVRTALENALMEGLRIFAKSPDPQNNPRPENILIHIVSKIKTEIQSLVNKIILDLKNAIKNYIQELWSQAENTVNQQLQELQEILNQIYAKIELAEQMIKQAIATATKILEDPVGAGKEILFSVLKPWIPPIFLKVLVVISDLYSVFSSAMALVKYIKNMGCANIILKGIGIGTTSAALVMAIYQTCTDINEIVKEAEV
ncbi:MAG: hypothetical protein QW620_08130 [Thermoplasmata archaeon]